MPTFEEVREQLAEFHTFNHTGFGKEARYLPQVLSPDERIYACARGFVDNATWMIVCTGTRIVLLYKGIFVGLKVKEIPLNSISSATYTLGRVSGAVTLMVNGSEVIITHVNKDAAKWLVDVVRWACEHLNNPIAPFAQPDPANDLISKLERIGRLHKRGLITDAQLEEQRERLLANHRH